MNKHDNKDVVLDGLIVLIFAPLLAHAHIEARRDDDYLKPQILWREAADLDGAGKP